MRVRTGGHEPAYARPYERRMRMENLQLSELKPFEESARVGVGEAARILECSPLFLRVALQQGLFPFGKCLKLGGRRYSYYINRQALLKYVRGEG